MMAVNIALATLAVAAGVSGQTAPIENMSIGAKALLRAQSGAAGFPVVPLARPSDLRRLSSQAKRSGYREIQVTLACKLSGVRFSKCEVTESSPQDHVIEREALRIASRQRTIRSFADETLGRLMEIVVTISGYANDGRGSEACLAANCTREPPPPPPPPPP
jgi:hypothetical protein